MIDPVVTVHIDTTELDAAIRKMDTLITLQQRLRCAWWCPFCALSRWWRS